MVEVGSSAKDFIEIGFGVVISVCGSGCVNGIGSRLRDGRIWWHWSWGRHWLLVAVVATLIKRCLDESII